LRMVGNEMKCLYQELFLLGNKALDIVPGLISVTN
jgi:hypothetical protein